MRTAPENVLFTFKSCLRLWIQYPAQIYHLLHPQV